MPPTWFVIIWTVASATFTAAGALWAVSPRQFVRVTRWIAFGDYYLKSTEWETSADSMGGRITGCLIMCFGLGGLYLLLKSFHFIK